MNEQTYVIDVPHEDVVSAVRIRNAVKCYTATAPVLNHLNLCVPLGCIYGLLGPSGCGKTTLLKCILGKTPVDKGKVTVFGEVRSKFIHSKAGSEVDVGYMPQELALSDQLTIKETLQYYGSLVGMSQNQIKNRIKHLVKLLQLPSSNRLVKELSGGQQRRVSFATALLNEAKLLILDEPTVGVDPPLRKKMWNYLNELAINNGQTVIITTHYIEEARSSNLVGMMFEGKLLAEAPPEQLITEYGKQNLDDVFLHLVLTTKHLLEDDFSVDDDSGQLLNPSIKVKQTYVVDSEKDTADADTCTQPDAMSRHQRQSFITKCNAAKTVFLDHVRTVFQPISLRRLSAVVFKDLAQMRHNIGFPQSQAHEAMYQVVRGIRTRIYHYDYIPDALLYFHNSPMSRVVAPIKTEPVVVPRGRQRSTMAPIKNEALENVPFNNTSMAYQSLTKGDVWATMYFKPNFTEELWSKYAYGAHSELERIQNAKIELTFDNQNPIIKGALFEELISSFISASKAAMKQLGISSLLGGIPINLVEPLFGNAKSSYQDFIVPGIMIIASFYLSTDMTSTTLIEERLSGQLERSIVCGVRPLEVVLAVVITRSMLIIAQSLIMLMMVYGLFGLQLEGSVFMVILVVSFEGLAGLSYGIFLSAISSHQVASAILIIGTVIPLLIISGIVWPLEGVPTIIQYGASILPVAFPTDALRGVVGRGWWFHHVVVKALAITTGWFVVLIVASIMVVTRHW